MSNFTRLAIIIISFLFFECEQFSRTKNVESTTISNTNSNTDFYKAEGHYLIQGTSFSQDKTFVYLFKAMGTTFDLVDSTMVNNTKFQFKGLAKTPSMYRVSEIKNKNKGFSILVDDSKIDVFLNKRRNFSKVYGTSSLQKKYINYTSKMLGFKDKGMALYYGLKGNFSTENIKNLKKERFALFTEQNQFIESYIKEHSNSYIAALLIKENIGTYGAKKLRALYNDLSQDVRDLDYSKRLDSLIVEKESKIKEHTTPVVAIKKTVENFTEESFTEESFNGEYRPKAYAISGSNQYGEKISLKSIPKGKVVLVDFWASWCAPCRASNPNLVALHKKYKNQGFEILSVSEDKGEAEWLNAIAVDGLTWDYHVLDNSKRIAFRYGVESIPFKLLIDKQGNIASDKIYGRALESRIIELLAE